MCNFPPHTPKQEGWELLLQALKAREASEAEIQQVKEQAITFYNTRKTSQQNALQQQDELKDGPTPGPDANVQDTHNLSFQEVARMIVEGKEPPNVQHFDDTVVSSVPPSQPTLATQPQAGKKPWEA